MAIIHKNVPLELLDCPEIQAAEIALEAALEAALEKPQIVKVEVYQGCVEVTKCPAGVTVEIEDLD